MPFYAPAFLATPADGKPPYQTLLNAVAVLDHDPMWSAQRLWYDESAGQVMCAESPTRAWRDDDDVRLTIYMQEHMGMPRIQKSLVSDAVDLVARRRSRHPIREWLESLKWDGIHRLTTAFEDYWGAMATTDQPSDYLQAASRNFPISLVRRVMEPGCKCDTMPVFEGDQGIKKTSALEILGAPWFASIDVSAGDKDFLQALRGKWLIEIDELNAFSKTEASKVKGMLSRRVDHYRPSYGRRTIAVPRQCVFAGTTNQNDWAIDDTGNRRFWPIECGEIRIDLLALARDQLFAEAAAAVAAGEPHWIMPETTRAVQASRHPDHAWTAPILEGLIGQSETTLLYVLTSILKIKLDDITRPMEWHVGSILRHAGWVGKPARRNGRLSRIWFSPETLRQNTDVLQL